MQTSTALQLDIDRSAAALQDDEGNALAEIVVVTDRCSRQVVAVKVDVPTVESRSTPT